MSRIVYGAFVISVIASGLTGACEARQRATPMPETASAGVLSIDDATGLWRVVDPNGSGTCLIALSRFSAPAGGYGVQVESCALPALAGSVGWRPVEGGFELTGSSGNRIATFHRRSDDDFESAEGGYRLERAPLA